MARLPGRNLPDQIRAFRAKSVARLEAASREIVEETARRIVARTPIDTGLLASSYNYSIGSPDRSTPEAPGERAVNGITALPAHPLGLRHFVSSSVHYAGFVEHGTSRMAPRAMVGLTLVELPDIIRGALALAKTQKP